VIGAINIEIPEYLGNSKGRSFQPWLTISNIKTTTMRVLFYPFVVNFCQFLTSAHTRLATSWFHSMMIFTESYHFTSTLLWIIIIHFTINSLHSYEKGGQDCIDEFREELEVLGSESSSSRMLRSRLNWEVFVSLPGSKSSIPKRFNYSLSLENFRCSKNITDVLSAPLSGTDLNWCMWALNTSVGKEQVIPPYFLYLLITLSQIFVK